MKPLTYAGVIGLIVRLVCFSHVSALSTKAMITTADESVLKLDNNRLQSTIRQGRVYQQINFLTQQQTTDILLEIDSLQASFVPSGLSNTLQRQERQGFGRNDRLTCAVPWWKESLEGGHHYDAANSVIRKVQTLRLNLAEILHRPTMADASLTHECYYSVSQPGSSLPRHMDERHEEFKGTKGWMLPSRRSLSWLVYLNDKDDWSLERNGGALCTFPQKQVAAGVDTISHAGNLQVGWLIVQGVSRPVYLDSWFQFPGALEPLEPHCILYKLENGGERVDITKPWLTDALQGMSNPDFVKQQDGLFLSRQERMQFTLLEDREAWNTASEMPCGSFAQDICPCRGSLVVFDSVLLPHQVAPVKEGCRIAIAGWFHEQTQPFPKGIFDTLT
jgi:hypothetical protein